MDSAPYNTDSPSHRFEIVHKIRRLIFSNPEREPRFQEEIQMLSLRGMRRCGVLGIVSILLYVTAMLILRGRSLSFIQGTDGYVSMVDKVFAMAIAMSIYAISFTAFGKRRARLAVGIALVLAGCVLTGYDVVNGDTSFSTAWLSMVLIFGIGTMPYRASHAFMLGVCVWFVYPLVLLIGPNAEGVPGIAFNKSQGIYLALMVIVGTGISWTLYENRHRAFRVRMELVQAGERIAEQAHRLQELDRVKARFFANISHEFRTPLTLMMGPVEDALQGYSGPISTRFRQQLAIARRNGIRLKELIDQLLDLSRLEAGKMELEPGMFDMISFSRTLVSSFSSLAEARDVNLSFHTECKQLHMAFDADKMEKILTNLLSNALKFTPAHGKVYVSVAEENGQTALVSVRDTGRGIAADEQALVFDRFHQTSTQGSDMQAGTGIGLALVRELTLLHDGTIDVESDEGFGSTFSLRLPIREIEVRVEPYRRPSRLEKSEFQIVSGSDESDPEGEASVPEDAPLVLIADDNDDVRAYLRAHLEKRYRIVEAANGTEAVELLQVELPALVLSDVMMPEMDGHEVCRVIKSDERTNHIPVVLVTARASAESRREGLVSGADDYLFKPFNAADLMIRVENLIEIRRILKERFMGEYLLKPTELTVKSAEAEFLERLQEIVEQHIGDTNFGVDWLASEAAISPRQLQRRLRSSLGLSASGYIRTLRLERAAQLLTAKAGTISEIAYQVGFLDANYFSRLFKQTFGISPSEFHRSGSIDLEPQTSV